MCVYVCVCVCGLWIVQITCFPSLNQIKPTNISGASGEVYLAEWQERRVAIKRLHPQSSLDENSMLEFDREVKLLRSLRHRNIVWFLGAHASRAQPFLVTEYVEQGPLYTILHESNVFLTVRRRIQFVLDTAQGECEWRKTKESREGKKRKKKK